jgi:hypothetical protein
VPCSRAGTARQSAASTPSRRTKRLRKCYQGCGTVKRQCCGSGSVGSVPCSPASTARQSAASTPGSTPSRRTRRLRKWYPGCGTVKDSGVDLDPSDPCLVHQQAELVNLLGALRLGEQEGLESGIRVAALLKTVLRIRIHRIRALFTSRHSSSICWEPSV